MFIVSNIVANSVFNFGVVKGCKWKRQEWRHEVLQIKQSTKLCEWF